MGLLDGLKRALGRQNAQDATISDRDESTAHRAAKPEEEPRVPEIGAAELLAQMQAADRPNRLLLDCREHYERAQGFVPGSIHIPMNSIPARLDELDREKEIVVVCAHGNRSYGVAGWLNQQGYNATSLKGGIVDWQRRGGPIESTFRSRS